MATAFDSFNRSPLDAFVQSPLQARGEIPTGVMRYATASLSFGVTPTAPYQRWPILIVLDLWKYWSKEWLKVGGVLVEQGPWGVFGGVIGGTYPIQAGAYNSGNNYRITRDFTWEFASPVPVYTPPGAWARVRAYNAWPGYAGTVAAPVEVYFAPTSVPCGPDGPAGGIFLGVAPPGGDTYLNAGSVIPGQRYYCFAKIVDDMSYITPSNPLMAWAYVGFTLEIGV